MATRKELEYEVLKRETLDEGKKLFANKYTETVVFGMVGVILLAFASVWVNSYIHQPVSGISATASDLPSR